MHDTETAALDAPAQPEESPVAAFRRGWGEGFTVAMEGEDRLRDPPGRNPGPDYDEGYAAGEAAAWRLQTPPSYVMFSFESRADHFKEALDAELRERESLIKRKYEHGESIEMDYKIDKATHDFREGFAAGRGAYKTNSRRRHGGYTSAFVAGYNEGFDQSKSEDYGRLMDEHALNVGRLVLALARDRSSLEREGVCSKTIDFLADIEDLTFEHTRELGKGPRRRECIKWPWIAA